MGRLMRVVIGVVGRGGELGGKMPPAILPSGEMSQAESGFVVSEGYIPTHTRRCNFFCCSQSRIRTSVSHVGL